MKKRRILAVLLAVMMVLSVLGVTAHAEETTPAYEETNTYVLNYNGAYDGPQWQYFSPYWPAFTMDGNAGYTQSLAFTLYDTQNLNFFPVYCTDLEVSLHDSSSFRRINLEDSTYAGAAAGKLRSIYLKGFPNTDVAALGAAAGVADLTVGEAVAATQAAIWQAAHGDRAVFTDFTDYIDTEWNPEQTAHFEECYAEIENGYASAANESTIDDHIEKVFNYLINLAPTAPTGEIASYRSFREWDSELIQNEDGTCNVVATATVDVTMNEGDELILTAKVGDHSVSTALVNGEDAYTLTIENVPAGEAVGAVTLAIDGVQSLRDVYLFDAIGDRGSSQSLIGITGSALPVHAEVNANDRILIVNKTDDGVGLQNITFDIYYVCSIEEYLTQEVILGTGVYDADGKQYFSSPTDQDIKEYVNGFPFVTITTDANGRASHNFGNENDGIYIVVERKNAVTTGAIKPFFVAIPGGSSADAADKYEITVKPKNTVIEEDVIIEKDVNEIDNNHDTHDVGETHTWIIQTSIPKGMATGLKYEITDKLNYQLTFLGNVRVTVSEKAAEAHDDLGKLIEGEDYILTVTEDTELVGEAEEPITSFKVALTRTGMEKVAAFTGTEPEVRVYFDACIDEDAIIFTEIPNKAHIRYENNVGLDIDRDSDDPEVHTGAGRILKVDASNHDKVLTGASFLVYRPAEEGDENVEYIEVDGRQTAVVKVSFYDNADMTGEKVWEVVSDEDGRGGIYGLAYGDYYLVETRAPEGYNLLTEPVKMTITEADSVDEIVVTIYNSAKFQLPETGGIGTAVFTFGGAGIIGAAAVVLLGGRKKRR